MSDTKTLANNNKNNEDIFSLDYGRERVLFLTDGYMLIECSGSSHVTKKQQQNF